MLVWSLCSERELAVVSTTYQHVVDLSFERQRQRVRTSARVRLSATNDERTVLNTTASLARQSCVNYSNINCKYKYLGMKYIRTVLMAVLVAQGLYGVGLSIKRSWVRFLAGA